MVKKKSDKLNSVRISLLILLNALILYSTISSREKKLDLLQVIQTSSDPPGELVKNWKIVTDTIDFVPIFHVARQILLTCYNHAEKSTKDVVKDLITTARTLTANQSALRHDLMGRIFHQLLPGQKYVAAYYTMIPVAKLLVGLSLNTKLLRNIDWTDINQISKINIADIACGSGTLLKACLDDFVEKHINECVGSNVKPQTDKLVKQLVEKNIFGYDIFTSNVHLAAVTLAVHYSQVRFAQMNLHPLPVGSRTNEKSAPWSLGSLSFFAGKSGVTVGVQQTLTGKARGPQGIVTAGKSLVQLPEIHFSIINPPFARSAYGTGVLNNIPNFTKVRAEISKLSAQNTPSSTRLAANLNASIATYFISGITKRQKNTKDAIQAIVCPKTLLGGSDWDKTRNELLENYNFKYIVSNQQQPWNFSERTTYSEILLVLEKKDSAKKHEIVYLNIWRSPTSTFNAISLLSEIQKAEKRIAELKKSGVCSLTVADSKMGELLSVPQDEICDILQLPANFAQTDMVRIAFQLYHDKIFVPKLNKTVQKIKTDYVANLFEIFGSDGRDVYDAFSIPKKGKGHATNYPAFWGSGKEFKRLKVAPNKFLTPLTTALPGRKLKKFEDVVKRAGSLLLPNTIASVTNCVFAVRCPTPVMANVWWASQWKKSSDKKEKLEMERRAVLWFNSTLGLLSIVSLMGTFTAGAYLKPSKDWWQTQAKMIDLSILSQKDLAILDKCWNDVHNKDTKPYSKVLTDPVRKKIDDVWCKILKIKLVDLKEIKTIFAREPMFTGKVIT